ncbi:MAG: hypothetical protein ACRYE7_01005 [Janthinobacterium lividum]
MSFKYSSTICHDFLTRMLNIYQTDKTASNTNRKLEHQIVNNTNSNASNSYDVSHQHLNVRSIADESEDNNMTKTINAERCPAAAVECPAVTEQILTLPTVTGGAAEQVINYVTDDKIPVIINYNIQSSDDGLGQSLRLDKISCNIDGDLNSENNLNGDRNVFKRKMFELNKKSSGNVKVKLPNKRKKQNIIPKIDLKNITDNKSVLKKEANDLVRLVCLFILDCIKCNDRQKYKISEIESAEMTFLYLMTGIEVIKLQKITWKAVEDYAKEFEFEQRTRFVLKKYFSKFTMLKLLIKLRKIKKQLSLKKQESTDPDTSKKYIQITTDQGHCTKQYKPMFTTKNVNCNTEVLQYFSSHTDNY